MLRFWKSSEKTGRRVGILPAAYNPVTIAHVEIARAARLQGRLDEVLFLLPLLFPHKPYTGASFEQRLAMLHGALAEEPQFSIGSTEGGLFIEIAGECRLVYGPEAEFFFLCGRDAAERIVEWDYRDAIPFAEQLEEFQILVAPRDGPYTPPSEWSDRIHSLATAPEVEAVSSTIVRDAIASGEEWEHLVPEGAESVIRRDGLYRVNRT